MERSIRSHRVANLLVGNAASAATLEVTLAGPELRIEEETRIAITGADLAPTIDGAATLDWNRGDLSIRERSSVW